MTETEAAAPAPAHKTIVNPKYAGKYKGENKDWLAKLLDSEATKTKSVTVSKADPANPDAKITVTEQRPDGLDVDALFAIAKNNGLDVTAYEASRANHGFPGRFRMTVGNMLRRVAKERHGVVNKGGTFVTAPADFLAKVKAPEAPTHAQDGTKIAPVVVKNEPAAPADSKVAEEA